MIDKKQTLLFSSSFVLSILIVFALLPIQSDNSNNSDNLSLGGVFILEHKDAVGNLLAYQVHKNLIPNEGLECIADLMFNGSAVCAGETVFSYLALGTTNTAPVDGDTALNAESGTCLRVGDATVDVDAAVTAQRNFTLISVFSGGTCEGEAYVEGGVFDRSSGGNMMATAIFSPSITLSAGETLTITYNVTAKNT